MTTPTRLEEILQSYLETQQSQCLYHNTNDYISLLAPHKCPDVLFPSVCTQILKNHEDEVWMVEFSHNGNYLGSISKDGRLIVWDVKDWKCVMSSDALKPPPNYITWSPNDETVLITSFKSISLWNPLTGTLLHEFTKHTEETSTCSFLPDSKRFISGASDRQIILWNVEGSVEYIWNIRGRDLKVLGNKHFVVVSGPKLYLFGLESLSKVPINVMVESCDITSVYASLDGRHVLVNLTNLEVHLWDIISGRIVGRYLSEQKSDGKFVIRSCFGGLNESFVLSGNEDSCVNVWHRDLQTSLEILHGHEKCVNSVSWNPKQNMFASGSDDSTIRIWTPGA